MPDAKPGPMSYEEAARADFLAHPEPDPLDQVKPSATQAEESSE